MNTGLQMSTGHLDFIAEPIHLLDHIYLMNRLVGAAGPSRGLSVFEESSMPFLHSHPHCAGPSCSSSLPALVLSLFSTIAILLGVRNISCA